jgi:hypothetical protein
MGSLERRLRKIEEQANSANATPVRSEESRYRDWLARKRIRTNELTPPDVEHARDMIALFRLQGSLAGESAARLIERIAAYPHDPGTPAGEAKAEGRSLALIEVELWRAVYHGEEGLEHMAGEMPDAWRDALAAADRWRERLTGMPLEAVARCVIANRALKERGTGKEIVALTAKHMGPFGIDEPLLVRMMGPDEVVLSPDQRGWLIFAPVADDLASEWAWRVGERIKQLDEFEGGT